MQNTVQLVQIMRKLDEISMTQEILCKNVQKPQKT